MICDDDVDCEFVRAAHHLRCTDPGVDANHERYTVSRASIHRGGLDAVAFFQPVWNREANGAPRHLEGSLQNDGGGDAVHVVIAVDADFLAVSQGALDTLQRAIHIEQARRRVQRIQTRMQERMRRKSIPQTARH